MRAKVETNKIEARRHIVMMLIADVVFASLWLLIMPEIPFPQNILLVGVMVITIDFLTMAPIVREYLFWKAGTDSYDEVFR
jgi:hypothetical protein